MEWVQIKLTKNVQQETRDSSTSNDHDEAMNTASTPSMVKTTMTVQMLLPCLTFWMMKMHVSWQLVWHGISGAQMKVSARNLRIREDTTKYLRNLDPNSTYYDPKSHSMHDNPNPEISAKELQLASDNFAQISSEAVKFAETQLFVWDATDKGAGSELHPQANLSQVDFLKKKFQTKSARLQSV